MLGDAKVRDINIVMKRMYKKESEKKKAKWFKIYLCILYTNIKWTERKISKWIRKEVGKRDNIDLRCRNK